MIVNELPKYGEIYMLEHITWCFLLEWGWLSGSFFHGKFADRDSHELQYEIVIMVELHTHT